MPTQDPSELPEKAEIVIVGAGAAGLYCAYRLLNEGKSKDVVIVERRATAEQGETVVALIDESEATLKRFRRDGASIRLEPANPSMHPIVVPADRVRVQGVAVGIIRKY